MFLIDLLFKNNWKIKNNWGQELLSGEPFEGVPDLLYFLYK